MAKRGKENKKDRSSQELSEILYLLEKQGLVQSDETYFEIIKQEILKKEQKEIQNLKKELKELSHKRFKNREEFFGFLEKLLLNPPPPLIS